MKNNFKNKYMRRSHLSVRRFREILKLFCMDVGAQDTANLTNISRYTINTLFEQFRHRLIVSLHAPTELIESPEKLFGEVWTRQKKGKRTLAEIVPIFGVRQEEGMMIVDCIGNHSAKELKPILKGKGLERVALAIDIAHWGPYTGIILKGRDCYPLYPTTQGKLPDEQKEAIDRLGRFWRFTAKRLSKFNGIAESHFLLHLKESACRFNYRNQLIYPLLLKHLKKHPILEEPLNTRYSARKKEVQLDEEAFL